MSKNFDSPIEIDFCGASGIGDPVPVEAALATERARVLQEALRIVRHTPQDGSESANDAVCHIESQLLKLIRESEA